MILFIASRYYNLFYAKNRAKQYNVTQGVEFLINERLAEGSAVCSADQWRVENGGRSEPSRQQNVLREKRQPSKFWRPPSGRRPRLPPHRPPT